MIRLPDERKNRDHGHPNGQTLKHSSSTLSYFSNGFLPQSPPLSRRGSSPARSVVPTTGSTQPFPAYKHTPPPPNPRPSAPHPYKLHSRHGVRLQHGKGGSPDHPISTFVSWTVGTRFLRFVSLRSFMFRLLGSIQSAKGLGKLCLRLWIVGFPIIFR